MHSDKAESLWLPIKEELKSIGIEIDDCLSVSNNSVLLKGKQTLLSREVAVKVLAQQYSETDYARFQQETKLLASFDHPNIVKLFGAGKLADGRAYMLLEYLPGKSLAQLLEECSEMSELRIRSLATQICAALAYSHERSIVHRDIKPANVMITGSYPAESAKLIDFGICKIIDDAHSQSLTRAGVAPGTANYMSPEQCRGDALDARSDIYSLGCLLYELCCGAPPMQADTDLAVMNNHLNLEISKLKSKLPLSADLERCVLRCLKKHPEERWSSALELKNRIESLPERKALNSPGKIAVFLSFFIALGLGTGALLKSAPQAKPKAAAPASGDTLEQSLNIRRRWKDFLETENEAGKLREDRCRRWFVYHVKNSHDSMGDLNSALSLSGNPDSWSGDDRLAISAFRDRVKNEYERIEGVNTVCNHDKYMLLSLLYCLQLLDSRVDQAEQSLDKLFRLPCSEAELWNNRLRHVMELMTRLRQFGRAAEVERIFKKYSAHYHSGEDRARLYYCLAENSLAQGLKDNAQKEYEEAARNFAECKHIEDAEGLLLFLRQINRSGFSVLAGQLLPLLKEMRVNDEKTGLCVIEMSRALIFQDKLLEARALLGKIEGSRPDSEPVLCSLHAFNLFLATKLSTQSDCRKMFETVLNDLNSSKFQSGDQELALQLACIKYPTLESLACGKLSDTHPYELGLIYAAMGHDSRQGARNDEAIKYYERACVFMDKSRTDAPGVAVLMVGYSDSLFALNKKAEAYAILDKAEKHLGEARKNCDEYLCVMDSRANHYRLDGKYKEAIQLHREALDRTMTRGGVNDGESFSMILLDLGIDYKAAAKYEDGIKVLEENLKSIRPDSGSKKARLQDMTVLLNDLKKSAGK